MLLAAIAHDLADTVGVDARRRSAANLDTPHIGPYERLELLGAGGMGQVWRAKHRLTGREVALKELRPEFLQDRIARRRFATEACLVSSLSHPGVVSVVEHSAVDAHRPYLVMELLRGESLAQAQERGRLPLAQAIDIARQLAEILAFIHARGVVHRDLKPENIFLVTRPGALPQVKLLDFGVAKLPTTADNDGTAAGVILGTPEYMSPEQLSGSPIDHKSDIYAFGVILYELLAGQKPFVAKTFGEMVIKHLTHTPVAPSLVNEAAVFIPEALEDLTLACLAKMADDRPLSISAVLTQLAAASTPRAPLPRRPRPFAVRVLATLSMIAAMLVCLAPWSLPRQGARSAQISAFTALPAKVPSDTPPIVIHFSSVPAGAWVYALNSATPIGQTPFTWETTPHEAGARFEFRLPGYARVRHHIELLRDTHVSVALAKRSAAPESKRLSMVVPPDTQLAQRRLIDPFTED